MPRALVNTGMELEYDTFGSPDDPALLLIMGFTAQMIHWDERFCGLLADGRPARHPLRQPRLRLCPPSSTGRRSTFPR
jgi:pimeloyl-ACP methyl ester carboxylesterase